MRGEIRALERFSSSLCIMQVLSDTRDVNGGLGSWNSLSRTPIELMKTIRGGVDLGEVREKSTRLRTPRIVLSNEAMEALKLTRHPYDNEHE